MMEVKQTKQKYLNILDQDSLISLHVNLTSKLTFVVFLTGQNKDKHNICNGKGKGGAQCNEGPVSNIATVARTSSRQTKHRFALVF